MKNNSSKTRRPPNHGPLTWRRLVALFFVFFRIGLFTFGGGYAMLPLIQKEVIDKKHWISEAELMDILVIAESTPGPVSVNTATYVGYRIAGFLGSLVSTLALALPSFCIIYLISLFFDQFVKIEWVSYAFKGIQAAVAVLIINAAERLFKKMPKAAVSIMIAAVTALFCVIFKLFSVDFSTVYFILIGAGLAAALAGNALTKELCEEKTRLEGQKDEQLSRTLR